ncbi:MAG TPA: NAD(P)/FAD-dependent oxidoreductase [Candidatus Rubrimentiphilum sp.]|nr:NAD(P)/FAD-dependent oxidoreductase [Candidatus Rubrimentiphilum sp.]
MYDVAIAGGGPAGSSAALMLARAGLRTIVIERSQFPRTKACGEYLNAGAVGLLRELGMEPVLAPMTARLDGIRLSGNGVRTELRFSRAGWALPRAQLDDALLRSAISEGALLLQARVEDVVQEATCVALTVREPDGEVRQVRARMAIGADGTHSIVAKKCGLTIAERGVQRFALGGHYSGFVDLEPFVEMFVEGSSYFAVNPFDAAHANVMVIVRENDLAARRDDVDRFVRQRAERLSGNPERFSKMQLDGKRIAVGPLAHATRGLAAGRVLLAGDAAGFVDPFTGQGVFLALHAGMTAAQAVAGALKSPAAANELLQHYEMTLARDMRQRERLARIVRTVVRSPLLSKRAARNLARDPARAQALIDALAGCGPVEDALRIGNIVKLVA